VEGVLDPVREIGRVEGVQLEVAIGKGEYTTFTGELLQQEKYFPAWLFPVEDPFVSRALEGLERSGLAPETRAYRFCTNAAYSAGVAGIPTVGFGPARETDAHMVDERVKLADLEAAARGYQGIIQSVLGS
jgi:acetylornithine deacetylase/succinyl-diaminopimelate desuccinylase-like protein